MICSPEWSCFRRAGLINDSWSKLDHWISCNSWIQQKLAFVINFDHFMIFLSIIGGVAVTYFAEQLNHCINTITVYLSSYSNKTCFLGMISHNTCLVYHFTRMRAIITTWCQFIQVQKQNQCSNFC